MDFGWILEGFSVTFGIIFQALYPMGFQVRSERDFGRILAPKGLQIRRANIRELVLEAILVPLGPQDGLQKPPRGLQEGPRGLQEGPRGSKEGLMASIFGRFRSSFDGCLLSLRSELTPKSINKVIDQ